MNEMRILRVNLDWLELFEKPTSAYELLKHSSLGSYSGAHKQVRSLEGLGLIVLTYSGPNIKNSVKKLFVLTKKGRSLLRLFPFEALIQAEEDF